MESEYYGEDAIKKAMQLHQDKTHPAWYQRQMAPVVAHRKIWTKGNRIKLSLEEFTKLRAYSLSTPTGGMYYHKEMGIPLGNFWKCDLAARYRVPYPIWVLCKFVPSDKRGFVEIGYFLPVIKLPRQCKIPD